MRLIWGVPVSTPDETIRTVSIVGPGYQGPPEHYHKQSCEVFEVWDGGLTLELDGSHHQVSSGESKVVETGVTHTFSNEWSERALVVTSIESPGRLRQVLPTLGGLAHDADRDPENPLQQAVIASTLSDNTVFTAPDGGISGVATSVLAPVGRATGYQGAYGEYLQPAFWRRHVEQPTAAELWGP
jgi:mannose-6-phosphate isomerase-like protein (cupin superfamily)